ncbi:SRPBCC family protein [Streptomyces beijiangensis]|uniref:SRPBCC family protein n=1 Tax=Streptomyces beijiangensis TaxID=163361 RepID=A0A939F444_9ACTN|nr:SRPBCC family protein [Streptomyces beijiangensis]MBO0511732.1 SRPBCC family protein [Streptomyces beijiangensis]
MPVFRVRHHAPRPPADTWLRVTDWPAHAASVPLTRTVVLTPPPAGEGTRFVARTAVGRFTVVDDLMVVVRWEPPTDGSPGVCRVEKEGSVLTGWAEIEVAAEGTGSAVTWTEELSIARLPAFADPLVARAGRFVFGRALAAMLRP